MKIIEAIKVLNKVRGDYNSSDIVSKNRREALEYAIAALMYQYTQEGLYELETE